MPNQNNFNQQSNNSSANNNLDDSQSQGIMGYVSPYASQAPFTQLGGQNSQAVQQNSTPVAPQQPALNQQMQTNANPQAPIQPQVQAQPSNPTIQDFVGGNPTETSNITTPLQPSIKSDNLLDDPDQVHQILNDGDILQNAQPLQPQIQMPQANVNPVMSQAQSTQEQVEANAAPVQTPIQPPVAQQSPEFIQEIVPQEIPDFLQDPKQAQMEVMQQMQKEKEALAKQEAEERAKKEAEEKAKREEIARQQAAQKAQYQAPERKNRPQFNNEQRPTKVEMNPEKDLAGGTGQKDTSGNKKFNNIGELLDLVIEKNASDLHLTVGYPPFIRIDDKLVAVGGTLGKEEVKTFVSQSLSQNQKELLEVNREVDLSYQHKDKGRFRINAYYERGNLAAAYRLIPQRIRTVTDLNLPGNLLDFTRLSQGLFLVTGPTGSGKSTTLAALLQHINETSPKHIITIEDPIEYVYPRAMALVDQRELGGDTHDWSIALKSALRQDPDVILIGELRDFDTIQSAITLAETGHLVFATLHTNSAAQSIDRIIDVFPPHQQQQIRTQLAGSLKGILSQRLVPLIGGGRKAVIELLIVTPAVQNLIREGKTYQIDNVVATSADLGMISLEKSLVKLVREGKITSGTAQDYAIRPEEILKLMKNNQL